MNNQKNTTAVIARPRVYICCPTTTELTDPVLRANEMIGNLTLARDSAELAVIRGYDPVVPQFSSTLFPDDETDEERELIVELSLIDCDELWIMGWRISADMSSAIKRAQELGIPVMAFAPEGFRRYVGTGDVTDNCLFDTIRSVSA